MRGSDERGLLSLFRKTYSSGRGSRRDRGGFHTIGRRLSELFDLLVLSWRTRKGRWIAGTAAVLLSLLLLVAFGGRGRKGEEYSVSLIRRSWSDPFYLSPRGEGDPNAPQSCFSFPFLSGDDLPEGAEEVLVHTDWFAVLDGRGGLLKEYRVSASPDFIAPGWTACPSSAESAFLLVSPDGGTREVSCSEYFSRLSGRVSSPNGRFWALWGEPSKRRAAALSPEEKRGPAVLVLVYDLALGRWREDREVLLTGDPLPERFLLGNGGEVVGVYGVREEKDEERGEVRKTVGGWLRVWRGGDLLWERETCRRVMEAETDGDWLLTCEEEPMRRGKATGARTLLVLRRLSDGVEDELLSSSGESEPAPQEEGILSGARLQILRLDHVGLEEEPSVFLTYRRQGQQQSRVARLSRTGEVLWDVPGELPPNGKDPCWASWVLALREGYIVALDAGTGRALAFSEGKGYSDAVGSGWWLLGKDEKSGALDLYDLRELRVVRGRKRS